MCKIVNKAKNRHQPQLIWMSVLVPGYANIKNHVNIIEIDEMPSCNQNVYLQIKCPLLEEEKLRLCKFTVTKKQALERVKAHQSTDNVNQLLTNLAQNWSQYQRSPAKKHTLLDNLTPDLLSVVAEYLTEADLSNAKSNYPAFGQMKVLELNDRLPSNLSQLGEVYPKLRKLTCNFEVEETDALDILRNFKLPIDHWDWL